MRGMRKALVFMTSLAIVIPVVSSARAQPDFTLLHSFAGGINDGSSPRDSLILDGNNLYGITLNGGSSDYGTIFSIQTGGIGFTLLHSFSGGNDDGMSPWGSLILDESTLYGMTLNGGSASNYGTIFSIHTDHSGFTLLHNFAGGNDDGNSPYGGLIIDDSTLYGMTAGGGFGLGTVFSIQTGGIGFTLLHSFAGGNDDGNFPWSDLVLDGNTLYGMTRIGGSSYGTIFSIQTGGFGFTLLHRFAGGNDDGMYPEGSLILDGSTLYGMTPNGGSAYGTVFSIQIGGSDFTLLHSFSGGNDDGRRPYDSLILDESTLYGMTLNGGSASSYGTIFSIHTDHSSFTLLHRFAGGNDDGRFPYDNLILDGGILYGMTRHGGTSDCGTIFSLGLEESTPTPTATPIPTPSAPPTPSMMPTPSATPTVILPTSPTPTPSISPMLSTPTTTPISGAPPWITDYNGDGTSDITIFRGTSALWAIRGVTRVYFGGSTDEIVPGDYNGDGTTEIGIFRAASGLWAIRSTTRAYFGSGSDLPEPGDYDGDGTADIGIFRETSGLWAIRGVTRVYFGGAADSPVSGYYDGDATKDIGIFRGSSGLWAIRNVTRNYFGSSLDTIVPGDYNGDGTWETGIFRRSSGLWAIRGVTRSYFGNTLDQPVPADYLGDAIDDIGIFRGASGLWAIRGVSRIYFGGAGDVPVVR